MMISEQLDNSITKAEAQTKIASMLDPVQTDKEGNQVEKPKKKPKPAANAEGGNKAVKVEDAESAKGKKTPAKAAPDQSDEEHAEDTDEDTQTAEDNADDAEDLEGEEDQADDAQGENDEGDEEELHTVVIDGNEEKIPYSELVAGYQRQADYSRNMAQVSKQRKEVEALQEQVKDLPKVRETYFKGAERFSQNAGLVLAALEQRFMPKAPTLELAKTDPAAYLQQKELHAEALQFAGSLQSELAAIEKKGLEELHSRISEGRVKLMEIQPELKEAGNRQKLKEYANKLGFTDEQMKLEPNPVLFQLAYKAMRFDEIMSKKRELAPNNSKPKVMKSTKAPDDGKAIRERKRTERLTAHKQAGTVNSAASALSGIISKKQA